MNIALVGYGKMGHIIEDIARSKGITVQSIIDPHAPGATHKAIDSSSMKGVDVCIEFSLPESVLENVSKIASFKKNHVLATTGWSGKLSEVKAIVKRSGTGIIYSSNFSVGVNLFNKIVESAARIVNNIPEYDVLAYELHHNRKKDSPSGTAKSIGEILIKNISRKKSLVYDIVNRKISPDELHFASVRGGDIPGTHTVLFDSAADTIELKHTARNREGFAIGAVLAAEWLNKKKGIFVIDDMMDDILKGVEKHV